MKILNLDGHYFVAPLKQMGHDVLWIGPYEECDIQLTETLSLANLLTTLDNEGFTPDIAIWADICRPPSVIGIEHLPCVTVGYSIDQYCNPWHLSYSAAFDLMLVAQKDYVGMFENEGMGHRLEWFPLFCNATKDIDHAETRDIPASFVGTLEGIVNAPRKKFMDDFKQHHPLFVTRGNYVPIYNRSQIVLNQSAAGELNFRIFEAMSCGAAVLTEDTENGLSDLFTNGEDILLYPRGNPQAAAIVAKMALNNHELATIAKNGQRKVLAEHTSLIRSQHILKCVEAIAAEGQTWRKQNIREVQQQIFNTYSMLAFDENLPLPPELRELYSALSHAVFLELQQ